jgi:hypothetical protein
MADIVSTTTREEVIGLAALAGLTGLGIIVVGLQKPAGPPLPPGSSLSPPIISTGTIGTTPVNFPANGGTLTLPATGTLTIINPQVRYSGPSFSVYTYAQIKQIINGTPVTVFGSGVAGIAVGPASSPTLFPLVRSDQVQPTGPPGPYLTLYPWPGPSTTVAAICGAPPKPGIPGSLHVQIYGDQTETGNPADTNGYSSPTCNNRKFFVEYVWPGSITFV